MFWTVFTVALACAQSTDVAQLSVEPEHRVGTLPMTLTVTAKDSAGDSLDGFCGSGTVEVPGQDPRQLTFHGGRATVTKVDLGQTNRATISVGPATRAFEPHRMPGFFSILPPLLAILLAIVTRQALFALFGGIWLAAFFVHDFHPLRALLRTFDTYLVRSMASTDHAAIILFTLALGGLVGLLSKAGATRAIVDLVAARAKTRRAGMLTTWAAGLVVFFDDYANCLLVGNTVRPLTDRLRISREKLAYLIDSTAAPIATVAIISTWVGFQIGLFDGLKTGLPGDPFAGINGYSLFLSIIPYCFYSFLTMAFVLFIALSGRDFGPMLRAERRAIHQGQLLRPGASPLVDSDLVDEDAQATSAGSAPWWLAAVGIGSVVFIVMLGLYVTGAKSVGSNAGIREIISAADPYAVLMWAAFGGSLITLCIVVAGGWLTFDDSMTAWVAGIKSMVLAILVLLLAWGIGELCKGELQTGQWLLSQIRPSAHFLPSITFVGAALVATATGSSYSTMAIMIPIAAPLAWALPGADAGGLQPEVLESIRYATVAAVLGGAVFGDHCSPISDTTIMSSMSSACDHVDHVRTQLPYAITVGVVSILFGFIPAGYGISPLLSLPLAAGLLALVLRFAGSRAAEPLANTTPG